MTWNRQSFADAWWCSTLSLFCLKPYSLSWLICKLMMPQAVCSSALTDNFLPQVWRSASGQRRPPCCSGTTWRIERSWQRWRVCRSVQRSKVSRGNASWPSTWWTLRWRTGTSGFTASWPTLVEASPLQPRRPPWLRLEFSHLGRNVILRNSNLSKWLFKFFSFPIMVNMVGAILEFFSIPDFFFFSNPKTSRFGQKRKIFRTFFCFNIYKLEQFHLNAIEGAVDK